MAKAKVAKYNGVLLLNKPAGQTSHDAVQRVRRATGQRRVGHSGTLDPLAEGLLPICLGRATKLVRFVSLLDKTYEATIFLGQRSKTFDREGVDPEEAPQPAPDLTVEELDRKLDSFRGRIRQRVPLYSGVRVNGERLYKVARRGEWIEPPEREVEIKELVLLSYEKPNVRIRVTCSSGTYIRSIADDLGNQLGCGGYLAGLVRTGVGRMNLAAALAPEEVERYASAGTLEHQFCAYEQVLPFAVLRVTEDFAPKVFQGRDLTAADVAGTEGSFAAGEPVVVKGTANELLAIGTALVDAADIDDSSDRKVFDYERVLN